MFHLSKERASARLRHSSSASSLHSLRGIRKHGRLPYGAVAVISEQKKAQRRQQIQRQISLQQLAESKQDDKLPDDPAQVQTQKRPNASAAERKWRHEHWTKSAQDVSMKDDTPHDDSVEDEASLALAAELQQFAMQESAKDASAPSPTPPTEAQTPRLEADEDLYAQQLRGAKPLKYQPKPQPPRNREPPAVLVAEDPEDDWVYDTYVREYHDPMSAAPDKPMIDASQPKPIEPPVADNVGYLVIRTEDEEAWEELMSDGEGSEEERWEDEDDSNGKFAQSLRIASLSTVQTVLTCTRSGGLLRQRLPRGRGLGGLRLRERLGVREPGRRVVGRGGEVETDLVYHTLDSIRTVSLGIRKLSSCRIHSHPILCPPYLYRSSPVTSQRHWPSPCSNHSYQSAEPAQ